MSALASLGNILILSALAGCSALSTDEKPRTINLPCDTKLTSAAWNNGQLWYLTRPVREGERPSEAWRLEKLSIFGPVVIKFVESGCGR